jgi:hypothetical protein
VTLERCALVYEHDPHEWREGVDETHLCDGRLGDDDTQERDALTQLTLSTSTSADACTAWFDGCNYCGVHESARGLAQQRKCVHYACA